LLPRPDRAGKDTALSLLRVPAVLHLPSVGDGYELVVAIRSDILRGFPVFPILGSILAVETLDDYAGVILRAIRAGLERFLQATDFNCAFGFGDVPLAARISQLTALA
jgi:hypothetical protein